MVNDEVLDNPLLGRVCYRVYYYSRCPPCLNLPVLQAECTTS